MGIRTRAMRILVALASDLTGTVTFNPLSPLTISNGSSSASFTYTDTKAGTPTITVQSYLLTDVTQQETVNAAEASALTIETAANGSGLVVGRRTSRRVIHWQPMPSCATFMATLCPIRA